MTKSYYFIVISSSSRVDTNDGIKILYPSDLISQDDYEKILDNVGTNFDILNHLSYNHIIWDFEVNEIGEKYQLSDILTYKDVV